MSWNPGRGAPSMARRMSRRLGLLLVVAALPLALWGVVPLLSGAETPGSIQNKIESARGKIEQHRARERVLTSDITAANQRIGSLQADITQLQSKQVRLTADLEAKRAELAQIQEDLRRERLKLARLRDRLARARVLLADRLVQSYKDDAPDVVTVVLEADGFSDLLERAEYMERVSDQDARLIDRVTVAKAEAIETAQRLDRLEQRAQEVARQIEGEVAQVVQVKGNLVDRRDQFAAVRADKAEMLAGTRASRAELEEHVASLEKEQSAILAKLQGSSSPVAGPVKQGSGGLVWPVSGPVTSGFGYRWGRLHAGVDIAVPVGTPVHAAASGRVAIAGWVGGYGNYVCIQHSGSLSTCYGHNSSIGVSVGQSVSQGQVIAASGNTGNSTGPHVHFETRINGNPVDPMGYL
jgi:murein DD-endopeptidase MepM/ murein hydrolase activator NlpD